MKNISQGNLTKVLTTALIVLVVIAVFTAARGESIFAEFISWLSAPFQQTTAELSEELNGGSNKSKSELIKENNELHSEINSLISQVIDYDAIKKENEMLKKYYGIKENNPGYEIAVASVIRRDPNDDFYGFTIDKGSRDDVSLNDPVITDNGLVGWISEVNVTTSKVTTLLSPEAKVGAIDKKTQDSGIATGNVVHSDDGQLVLSVISADNTIKEGDIVLTTGVGGVYPADLVIGKVASLQYDRYDTTPYAVLQPYEDLRSINDVVVITSFEGQGVVAEASDTDSDKKTQDDSDIDENSDTDSNYTDKGE